MLYYKQKFVAVLTINEHGGMDMKGLGVSPGIAFGKAYVIKDEEYRLSGVSIGREGVEDETAKLLDAVKSAVHQIEVLICGKPAPLSQEEQEILRAHIELLGDPTVINAFLDRIGKEYVTAVDAVILVKEELKQKLLALENEYFQARAGDIEDIGRRILRNLQGGGQQDLRSLHDDVVIIAEDLTPSDTVSMNKDHVLAFATSRGSRTSHTAIIANIRGIPAVVGCGEQLGAVRQGDFVIVDGFQGDILLNPEDETLRRYKLKQVEYIKRLETLKGMTELPAQTIDGIRVTLAGNISTPDEISNVLENGGEEIGLFRTEFLYMDRADFPGEEEQYGFYKRAAENACSKPVIIRTLDIGGDKQLCYFDISQEMNPFLGYRAIRICLDRKDIFKTQIKAILRASKHGNLKIMFPMISGVDEFRQAKAIVLEIMEELDRDGIEYDREIPLGIMVEVPSAALTADILAQETDFFSIGTNDLCQYTLAVDRMNEKISNLYNPYEPAVLRLIQHVIVQGHRYGIKVGMCGEMASDPKAVLLLLGMGLDEFSMSPSAIPAVKEIIRNTRITEAVEITKQVMQLTTSKEVLEYLKKKL